MATKDLTQAIAALGSNPTSFDPALPGLEKQEKEILSSGDGARLLDVYAPGDATKLATLVARLATYADERDSYFDTPSAVLAETGLSEEAQRVFREGNAEGIDKVLRSRGGPGEGGELELVDDPD